ncbi:hypothetical protein [Arthrobacter bambusae]|uniref:hypothetical protein n=1 Tax=Arthrobacter bambusae TaxID=1338426 RepID=UPI0027876950|nr:hypothetical protein [Arthrobacter bambusae]MDQ0028958.1 hypothetical protein [Arthrobacter bambusae]MDQ0098640.1 hypothetical protein [Arthrobacter bambusae]
MSNKSRSWLWFLVPTLVATVLVIAISIPGLEGARQEIGADSLVIPIVAMLILAVVAGSVLGLTVLGLRHLVRPRSVARTLD